MIEIAVHQKLLCPLGQVQFAALHRLLCLAVFVGTFAGCRTLVPCIDVHWHRVGGGIVF